MKDGILDITINSISDGLKDRNSGRITGFSSLYAIPKVSIEEHVVESFQSTLKEVCKHAKRLENIITLIENFSLILVNKRHIKDVLWTRKITHFMIS